MEILLRQSEQLFSTVLPSFPASFPGTFLLLSAQLPKEKFVIYSWSVNINIITTVSCQQAQHNGQPITARQNTTPCTSLASQQLRACAAHAWASQTEKPLQTHPHPPMIILFDDVEDFTGSEETSSAVLCYVMGVSTVGKDHQPAATGRGCCSC